MMDFLTLAANRFSVRKYNGAPIEKEKLNKILKAAELAPSAVNKQPIHLIVAQSKEALEKIGKGAKIYGAGCAIIVCADSDKAWVRSYDQMQTTDIDASIVTDHMMLEATDLGLGSLWICMFDPQVIREEFNIPKNLTPINILALGYTDWTLPEKKRVSFEEFTEFV